MNPWKQNPDPFFSSKSQFPDKHLGACESQSKHIIFQSRWGVGWDGLSLLYIDRIRGLLEKGADVWALPTRINGPLCVRLSGIIEPP